ncbi:hypothetical protein FB45DRAFT_1020014 [Roridomyces roridus]|uniref:Uncharacterized protein n=1 Tax=Roridomyces roridus TaxID=1738132 RepID=A0AAD7CG43_9AGAR|nr:hypothetical protein FB45DRAFT_1020014 [Roridomyces roridus]
MEWSASIKAGRPTTSLSLLPPVAPQGERLHQPGEDEATPAADPSRGPSSGTSDVVDHLKASPGQFFDRNPAASKCSPLAWRSRLLEKTSRLQEGRMDVLRSTLLLQVAPRFAARMATSLDGAASSSMELDWVGS